jgi:hypothetical protein
MASRLGKSDYASQALYVHVRCISMSQPIQMEPKRVSLASEPQPENAVSYPPLIAIVSTIAALYFGRAIFMPLATAILLTFALAPVVGSLRKLRCQRQSRS